ncbi:30S ribosomal protein S13 [Candidatus Parcubacteria bacterium]|nr:30S ribosomal protein S13 [Candidatus Parcubacteria bacterium]
MPRVAGTNIPDNKHIEVALTHVYGLGRAAVDRILGAAKIAPTTLAADLTPSELATISSVIERGYKVEGDLRREVSFNIKRLKDIGAYRGLRHLKRLPVRGQGTRTNSRTVRGNVRRTMGSGKRKLEKT